MSHEIRTPMNGIIGNLELMEDLSLPQEGARRLAAVRRSGEFLLNIIDEILDLGEIRKQQSRAGNNTHQSYSNCERLCKSVYGVRGEKRGFHFDVGGIRHSGMGPR